MALITPQQLADNTIHTAADHNNPINTIANEFNGNIDNANIKAAAGIATSKIASDGGTLTAKLSNPYRFRARRVAALTLGGSSFQKVTFDTEDFDSNNNFDVTTNIGRYTAPIAGWYQFNARWSSITTSLQVIALYKNGTIYQRGNHGSTSTAVAIGTSYNDLVQAAANDYFEMFIFYDGTGAMEAGTGSQAYFSGYLVSV